MAISDSARGVKVTIRVNGQTAKEYDNPPENEPFDPKTVTKYIESIDDAKFSVFVEAGKRYEWGYKKHLLRFTVTVDGEEIWRHAMKRKDGSYDILGALVWDAEQGAHVREELSFSSIKFVNTGVKQVSPDLGVIQVTVTRVRKVGYRQPMPELQATGKWKALEVTERHVKGRSVSHGTTVSTGVHIDHPECYNTFPILKDLGPIATFRFIYRSRALKHELIIPRSPSPPSDGSVKSEVKTNVSAKKEIPVKKWNYVKEEVSVKKWDCVKKEVEAKPFIKRERSVDRGFSEFTEATDITDDDSDSRYGKRARCDSPTDMKSDSE